MRLSEHEIRLDWNMALDYMEKTNLLFSADIGWGFTSQDLLVICCLHENGLYRDTIEQLLDDCNFHLESWLLHDGEYNKCRKEIMKNLINNAK